MPAPELQEFFAKIQGGDEGAVEAMLNELDPFLRRLIRMRLTLADNLIAAPSPTIATVSGGVASGGHQSKGTPNCRGD